MWNTGNWSSCESASSGNSSSADEECPAFQFRNVYCERIVSKGVSALVPDDDCIREEKAGEKPEASKSCSEDEQDQDEVEADHGPRYHAGPWGGCSALCGTGVRKRTVTCFKRQNDTIEAIETGECEAVGLEAPEAEEECESGEASCKIVDWVVTDWTSCPSDDDDENCGKKNEIDFRDDKSHV